MESIKSTVMAICAISAARSIVGGILSDSKLKSSVILMLDLFLALTLITPIAQGTLAFEFPDLSYYTYTSEDLENDAYGAALKAETEQNINDILINFEYPKFNCGTVNKFKGISLTESFDESKLINLCITLVNAFF
jgi:hypothetical protein